MLGAGAGLAASVAVESGTALGEAIQPVKARGYWELVWIRFKRDKVAIAGGVFIIILLLIAFIGASVASRILGHGPNQPFPEGLDQNLLPVDPWTTVSEAPYIGAQGDFGTTLFVLGGDGQVGRDLFLRLLYGAQTSLEVAILATLFSVTIGVIMGLMAGYFRGWVDTIVSRLTEIVMAFPALLFIIAIAATVGERLNTVTFGVLAPGVFTLVLIFSLFGWFYPARIIRGQVLSLREKEFIEAARMTGAGDGRIMISHLLPHLVAPIIVYSTLIVANNIIAEAGLSFLGVGVQPPTPSWGVILAEGFERVREAPWPVLDTGLALMLATLGFTLLGETLRDVVDPRLRAITTKPRA